MAVVVMVETMLFFVAQVEVSVVGCIFGRDFLELLPVGVLSAS